MPLKSSKIKDYNSVSPACNIRLVIPQGTEDLSGKSFLIWVVSSSRVKGSMKRGWMCWHWTPVLVQKRGGKKSVLLLSRRMGKVCD